MTELADQVRGIRCRRGWWGPEITGEGQDRVLRWWHDDPDVDDLELNPADRSGVSRTEWEWVMLKMAAAPAPGTRPEDLVEIARRALIPTGTPVVSRQGAFGNDKNNAWITAGGLAALVGVDRAVAGRALAKAARAGVMVDTAKTRGRDRSRWPGETDREKNSWTFPDAAAVLDAWATVPRDQLAAAGLETLTAAFDTSQARYPDNPSAWGLYYEQAWRDREVHAAIDAGLGVRRDRYVVPAARVADIEAVLAGRRAAAKAAEDRAKAAEDRARTWAVTKAGVDWPHAPTARVPAPVLEALLDRIGDHT